MKPTELKKAINPYKDFIDALVASEDTIKGVFTIRDASAYVSSDADANPTPSDKSQTLESKIRFRFMAKEEPTVSHLLKVANKKKNAKDNGIFADAGYYCDISYITFINALNFNSKDSIHDLKTNIKCIFGNPEIDNDGLRAKALTDLLRGIRVSFVQSALCDKDEYTQSNGDKWHPQPGQFSVITEVVDILPAE